MSKLTRQDERDHEEAEALLSLDRALTHDERLMVFDQYHPGARHLSGKNAAYFTPWPVADVVARNISTDGLRVLDLAAGIGSLAYAAVFRSRWEPMKELVCIELNPDYVEAGKRLVPEATWICGDIYDEELLRSLGTFDVAISNPPFNTGKIGTASRKWLRVKSPAHMQAVEVGLRTTRGNVGVFVLPQVDLPWRYSMYPRDWKLVAQFASARRGHEYTPADRQSAALKRFYKAYPDAHFGCVSEDIGMDEYAGAWKGVKDPPVEVVSVFFDPPRAIPAALPGAHVFA